MGRGIWNHGSPDAEDVLMDLNGKWKGLGTVVHTLH